MMKPSIGRTKWIVLGLIALFAAILPLSTKAIARIDSFSALVPESNSVEVVKQQLDFPVTIAGKVDTPPAETSTPAPNSAPAFVPPQESAPAHPTNYGDRYITDIDGNPALHQLIVVIHETVGSASSAINTFQTPHYRDSDQVSYHTLIKRDGTIVYIVPPQNRAFGAGNSVFEGPNGPETVRTHADFPPSVNNFAYHTSLETPPDGRGNGSTHSGYTEAQYRSLAWLLAHIQIPESRITTHRAVDRSGTRLDPRSFNEQQFRELLYAFRQSFQNHAA